MVSALTSTNCLSCNISVPGINHLQTRPKISNTRAHLSYEISMKYDIITPYTRRCKGVCKALETRLFTRTGSEIMRIN